MLLHIILSDELCGSKNTNKQIITRTKARSPAE